MFHTPTRNGGNSSSLAYTEVKAANNESDEDDDDEEENVIVTVPPNLSPARDGGKQQQQQQHAANDGGKEEEDDDDWEATSHAHGWLRLPQTTTSSTGKERERVVPNCCAICLMPYEIDETVVWSSNPACPHAFHEDCLLDWLVHGASSSKQEGTPCPCCRQSFTDLRTFRKERKIRWAAENTFNTAVLRL